MTEEPVMGSNEREWRAARFRLEEVRDEQDKGRRGAQVTFFLIDYSKLANRLSVRIQNDNGDATAVEIEAAVSAVRAALAALPTATEGGER